MLVLAAIFATLVGMMVLLCIDGLSMLAIGDRKAGKLSLNLLLELAVRHCKRG